jgi:transcriptional regulator with PAS, ATPase and Fis domain
LFARAIHARSARRQADFVTRNCAAIPREFFESDLFGIKAGTATGVEGRSGAFEEADGGILFLDEVGDLSLDNQAKLLRALQPKHGGAPCSVSIRRVGEPKGETQFSVRIIADTNRNLLECCDKGTFRADLYYRLARIRIELPPLRARKSDIRGLAESYLASVNKEFREGKYAQPGYQQKKLPL